MPPPDIDSDLGRELLAEVGRDERRLIVVAADPAIARTWAKYREVRKFYIAEDAVLLTGLRHDHDMIVLVDGYQGHKRYSAIRKRLSVEGGRDVPILRDALPAGTGPAKPQIGGAYCMGNTVNRIPFDEDQGDTFVIAHHNGNTVLRRAGAEQLAQYLEAWLAGDPVADPAMDRLLAIKSRIEDSGDLYGRAS